MAGAFSLACFVLWNISSEISSSSSSAMIDVSKNIMAALEKAAAAAKSASENKKPDGTKAVTKQDR